MKKLLFLASLSFLTACSQGGGIESKKDENVKVVETEQATEVISIKEDETYYGAFRRHVIADKNSLYEILQNPASGLLTKTTEENFTFVPAKDFSGNLSFTFQSSAGEKTVAIEVVPVNDSPVVSHGTLSVQEGQNASLALSIVDPDSSLISCQALTTPAHGSVTFLGNTLWVNGTTSGKDQIFIKCNDGLVDSNVAIISLEVTDSPLSIADWSFNASKNLSYNGSLQGYQSGMKYQVTTLPAHGKISASRGTFVYTPDKDYVGADHFVYYLKKGSFNSGSILVSITVGDSNPLPTTQDMSITMDQGTVESGFVSAQYASSFTLKSSPAHGQLDWVSSTGAFVYTPHVDFSGADAFTYQVGNAQGLSSVATVNITVVPKNRAPTLVGAELVINEDQVYNGLFLGSDPDGDALTYTIVTQPIHGTVSISGGSFNYTPSVNYEGSDSFVVRASDGLLVSSSATMSFKIQGVEDAPVATDLNYTTNEDTGFTSNLIGTDVDSTKLVYTITQKASKGSVFLVDAKNGKFFYTPKRNEVGSDVFTYQVSDGTNFSNVATVTINITPVNDLPSVIDDVLSVIEDIPKLGLLASIEVDGQAVTYSIVAQPAHGIVVLNPLTGSYVYTPNLNYNGTDSFTYKANDGSGDSNVATINLTVSPINDAPIAQNLNLNLLQDGLLNFALVGSDVDGEAVTFEILSSPLNGVLSGTVPNLTFTPSLEFFGTSSFTYRVTNSLTSNVATVTFSVAQDLHWFDNLFTKRNRVYFQNLEATEDLLNFPVLITLNSSTINYADFKADGSDLRFVDKDGNLLAHEIDTWNTSGTSQIWVKVPKITAGASTDYVYMYHGNAAATSAENSANVWTNGYVAVWHMTESSGSVLKDATSLVNTGSAVIPLFSLIDRSVNGVIGGGEGFSPLILGAYFDIPNDNSLKIVNNLTMEAFVNPGSSSSDLLDRGSNEYGMGLSSWKPVIRVGSSSLTADSALPSGEWSYVSSVFDNAANTCGIYINGSLDKQGTCNSNPSGGNSNLILGTNGLLALLFNGEFDEVRISNVTRSASWIRAQNLSMKNAFSLVTSTETQASNYRTQALSIASTSDDGEITNTGVMNANNVAISAGQFSSAAQWSYFRFKLNKTIPRNAVITKANLKLYGLGSTSWSAGEGLAIYVQMSANASAVAANNTCPGCSNNINVSAGTTWGSPGLTWLTGQYNTSTNFNASLQQLVDTADLNADNYIQVWVSRGSIFSNNGLVSFEDKSNGDANSANLVLEWQ